MKKLILLLLAMLVAVPLFATDEAWVCPTRNTCYNSWGSCVVHASGGCPNGCTTGEYSRCDALLEACLGGEYCMPVY